MTLSRAVKITGLDIRREPDSRNGFAHFKAYYTNGQLCAEVTGRLEGESLGRLVEFAYKLTQDIVFERDGYQCVRCGSFRNLHTHHKIHRSKERIDSPENLETSCAACHDKEHNR